MPALPYWLFPGDDRPTEEIDDEIAEELRLHLDLMAEDHERRGLAPDEAKRQAAERFGDFDNLLRRCRREKQGDLPMLRRVQAVLIGLLVVAVTTVGWSQWYIANDLFEQQLKVRDQLASIDAKLVLLAPSPIAPQFMPTAGAQAPSPNGEEILSESLEPIGTLYDSENYTIVKMRRAKADLVGSVLGPNDECLANAHVLLIVKTWPNNRFRQDDYSVKTNKLGEFVLKGRIPVDGRYGVNAAVVAKDHAIASRYVLVDDPAGEEPDRLDFNLKPSVETRIVLTDLEGQPVAGALIAPSGRNDAADDSEHIVYHQGSNSVWKKTDEKGVATVAWFADGDMAEINIRARRPGEWKGAQFQVAAGEPVELRLNPSPHGWGRIVKRSDASRVTDKP